MTLAQRQFLHGALLPLLVLGGTYLAADVLFHGAMDRSVDRALLAQAAVESVSLFDGPRGEPHLHMASSPLVESVRPFAPQGTLFGPDGAEVMHYPPRPEDHPVEALAPARVGAAPALLTRELPSGPVRELTVTVASPAGPPYTLRLQASLAVVEQAITTFHSTGWAMLAAGALLLLVVQGWQSRRLAGRLRHLQQHVERVQAGDLDQPVPEDDGSDELTTLREALALATRRLQQARGAQERLLADAAHELRTPLTLMRTTVDLALRKERTAGELAEALRETRTEIDRLTALAGTLLERAELTHGPLERAPVDVRALVEEALGAARGVASERGVTLRVEGPAHLPADLHALSLRRALDNLLSNALRFAPGGSEVVVQLSSPPGRLVLEVRDQGIGIPPQEREAVFEPFHRLDHSGTGTGLGLSLVREVAQRHGGRAYVADGPGPGARLVLELPQGALLAQSERR